MKITLHVGLPKTGTTAIQTALAAKQDQLRQSGVLYPEDPFDPGRIMQASLIWLAINPDMWCHMRLWRGIDTEDKLKKARIEAADRLAMWSQTSSINHLVLSNEWITGKVSQDEEIKRLHGYLSQWSDDIRIVFFVRDQVALWRSYYGQQVRAGSSHRFTFRPPAPGETYRQAWDRRRKAATDRDPQSLEPFSFDPSPFWFDIHHYASQWAAVFGRDALRFAQYGDGKSVGSDFAKLADLPEDIFKERIPTANISLGSRAVFAKRLFNAMIPVARQGKISSFRRDVTQGHFLHRLGGGKPAVSAAEKQRIRSCFAESNTRLGIDLMGLQGSPFADR